MGSSGRDAGRTGTGLFPHSAAIADVARQRVPSRRSSRRGRPPRQVPGREERGGICDRGGRDRAVVARHPGRRRQAPGDLGRWSAVRSVVACRVADASGVGPGTTMDPRRPAPVDPARREAAEPAVSRSRGRGSPVSRPPALSVASDHGQGVNRRPARRGRAPGLGPTGLAAGTVSARAVDRGIIAVAGEGTVPLRFEFPLPAERLSRRDLVR